MTMAKRTYRFDCPKCRNALEAKPEEVKMGFFKMSFQCPACGKKKTVARHRVVTVTEWTTEA